LNPFAPRPLSSRPLLDGAVTRAPTRPPGDRHQGGELDDVADAAVGPSPRRQQPRPFDHPPNASPALRSGPCAPAHGSNPDLPRTTTRGPEVDTGQTVPPWADLPYPMRVTRRMAIPAMLVAVSTCGFASQPSAREVQLRSLVQHPQQFEGKVLLVQGFLDLGREGDAICSDLRNGAKAFCVEIERSGLFLKERSERYSALQGHRV
jgi:hypothetical protein